MDKFESAIMKEESIKKMEKFAVFRGEVFLADMNFGTYYG
jgi:hypothetical protein